MFVNGKIRLAIDSKLGLGTYMIIASVEYGKYFHIISWSAENLDNKQTYKVYIQNHFINTC